MSMLCTIQEKSYKITKYMFIYEYSAIEHVHVNTLKITTNAITQQTDKFVGLFLRISSVFFCLRFNTLKFIYEKWVKYTSTHTHTQQLGLLHIFLMDKLHSGFMQQKQKKENRIYHSAFFSVYWDTQSFRLVLFWLPIPFIIQSFDIFPK